MSYNPSNQDTDYSHFIVEEPQPLLEFLLEHVTGSSRTKIKSTLKGRGIQVNGKTVTQYDYPLEKDMMVTVSKNKQRTEPFHSRYIRIVYEDQYLIVVEKNVGVLSMKAGHRSLNVKSILDEYFEKTKQRCTAHVVHRLDRDTSGLLVYAKDMNTEQIFAHNWHELVYDRRYIAVLSGVMEDDQGTVCSWLKENKAYTIFSSPVDNGGKYAVTHYFTLDRSSDHSLVEFKLETGRKNQIRVHAADLGHPVCGDF